MAFYNPWEFDPAVEKVRGLPPVPEADVYGGDLGMKGERLDSPSQYNALHNIFRMLAPDIDRVLQRAFSGMYAKPREAHADMAAGDPATAVGQPLKLMPMGGALPGAGMVKWAGKEYPNAFAFRGMGGIVGPEIEAIEKLMRVGKQLGRDAPTNEVPMSVVTPNVTGTAYPEGLMFNVAGDPSRTRIGGADLWSTVKDIKPIETRAERNIQGYITELHRRQALDQLAKLTRGQRDALRGWVNKPNGPDLFLSDRGRQAIGDAAAGKIPADPVLASDLATDYLMLGVPPVALRRSPQNRAVRALKTMLPDPMPEARRWRPSAPEWRDFGITPEQPLEDMFKIQRERLSEPHKRSRGYYNEIIAPTEPDMLAGVRLDPRIPNGRLLDFAVEHRLPVYSWETPSDEAVLRGLVDPLRGGWINVSKPGRVPIWTSSEAARLRNPGDRPRFLNSFANNPEFWDLE